MTLLDCGFKSSNNHMTTLNRHQDWQSYIMVKPRKSLNTMFGWRNNREDGKQREENRMKNSVFHCLACWGWKTREKIFSLGPTICILPNREKNCGEKIALTVELHKCPLRPTLFTNITVVLESSKKKKKKKQRARAGEKKKKKKKKKKREREWKH